MNREDQDIASRLMPTDFSPKTEAARMTHRRLASVDVTVLLPVGQIDEFLPAALRSVLSQEGPSVEVRLLLDGCSVQEMPDDLHNDLRVVVLPSKTRMGVASTLNRGMKDVRSRYVARMDADDVSLPGRFAAQVDFLERHPSVGVVGTAVRLIDRDGNQIGSVSALSGKDRVAKGLLLRNRMAHPTVMFRSSLAEVLRYDPRCSRNEDYHLWLRIAPSVGLDNLPEPFLEYRVHPGQWSRGSQVFGGDAHLLREARIQYCRAIGLSAARGQANHLVWVVGAGAKLTVRRLAELHRRRDRRRPRPRPSIFDDQQEERRQ